MDIYCQRCSYVADGLLDYENHARGSHDALVPAGHPGPARGTDCYTGRPWGRQWDCGCEVVADSVMDICLDHDAGCRDHGHDGECFPEPVCDICGTPETCGWDNCTICPGDWNGDTGNHRECERNARAIAEIGAVTA